jgi:hypothetical protein
MIAIDCFNKPLVVAELVAFAKGPQKERAAVTSPIRMKAAQRAPARGRPLDG